MRSNSLSFCRFFNRCNIYGIIREHYITFYDNVSEEKTCSFWEIFWQVIIFGGLAIALVYFGLYFSDSALDKLLTVQSILTAFLFSALFIVADKRDACTTGTPAYILRGETASNISFCILLSIILLIITTICSTISPNSVGFNSILLLWLRRVLNVIMYFLILNQIYVFLMVMKRVSRIFN